MRLASFLNAGKPGFGAVVDAGVIDLGAAFGGRFTSLRSLLEANALDDAARLVKGRKPDLAADALSVLPVSRTCSP